MNPKILLLLLFSLLVLENIQSQIGNSLVLNGCTDYFEIPDNDLLDYDQILSIEVWIKPNCEDDNRIIIGKQWCGPDDFGYYLSVNEGRLFWSFNKTGNCASPNHHQSRSVVISTDESTHISVVHTEIRINLFINGILINSEQTRGGFNSIHNSAEPVRIGAYRKKNGDITNHYSGLVDEIRFWNIELNESLIQSRMNTPLIGNESGLILYLDMEVNGLSESLVLENKSQYGSLFNAKAKGFTAFSPFIIPPHLYEDIPLDIGEDIVTCQDSLIISTDLINYKNLVWSTGETSPAIRVSNPGTYIITVETELCKFYSDTVKLSQDDYIFESKEFEICRGDSILLNNKFYHNEGHYSDTIITSINFCDTILEFSIFEIPSINQTVIFETCPGSTIRYNNLELGVGTSNSFIFESSTGCDSIVTVEVIASLILEEEFTLSVCEGSQIEYDGTLLSPGTSTLFSYTSQAGCDSLVTIIVNPSFPTEISQTYNLCENDTLFLNSNIYYQAGTFLDTLSSTSACDTFLEVNISIIPSIHTTKTIETCPNSTVTYLGIELKPNSSTPFILESEEGCDTIITINITSTLSFQEEQNILVCNGNTFDYNEITIEPNTTKEFSLVSQGGCDSIITINVSIANPHRHFLGNDTLVCNDNYIIHSLFENTNWNDGSFSQDLIINESGLYIASYIDTLGCINNDSILIEFQEENVFIPNTFSPNEDGNNDYFKPYFEETSLDANYILSIYNRWGDLVFKSSDNQRFWDGTFNGKTLNPAVFVWVLEYNRTFCNNGHLKYGNVTLVK